VALWISPRRNLVIIGKGTRRCPFFLLCFCDTSQCHLVSFEFILEYGFELHLFGGIDLALRAGNL